MTYDLAIGDRAYSSWSLRGWLLFDAFGIAVKTQAGRLYSDAMPALLARYAPARTVPVMRTPQGTVVADTIAIAEELASRHPEAGLWPLDPDARAVARMLSAEMHAGFGALRSYCPMNLRVGYADCGPSAAVMADLARIEVLWSYAFVRSGGHWLCGDYSIADAFYAPVAARIAGYGLPVSAQAADYVAAHLAHPSFRRWRAMSLIDGPDQPFYARDYSRKAWPGPAPLSARAVEIGIAENATCPYSGAPITHLAEVEGRVFGMCNAFCRDKTVADPAAWPAFMAIFAAGTSPEDPS